MTSTGLALEKAELALRGRITRLDARAAALDEQAGSVREARDRVQAELDALTKPPKKGRKPAPAPVDNGQEDA